MKSLLTLFARQMGVQIRPRIAGEAAQERQPEPSGKLSGLERLGET